MGRIGTTEIILLISTPLMFFLLGFFIGRISGKNSAYKKIIDKKQDLN